MIAASLWFQRRRVQEERLEAARLNCNQHSRDGLAHVPGVVTNVVLSKALATPDPDAALEDVEDLALDVVDVQGRTFGHSWRRCVL